MYGGAVIVKLASRYGYTLAVEVAQSIRKALLPNRLNKIAQNIEFAKSLPKSAIEKILPEELASLELALKRSAH